MGIFDHAGEPGVEAGSEDATCRRRAAKESMETLEAEERMKECGSRGELGGVDVVAGGGAGNQDQEARAQKCRREHGEEERRHRRGACVIYNCWRLPFRSAQMQKWRRVGGTGGGLPPVVTVIDWGGGGLALPDFREIHVIRGDLKNPAEARGRPQAKHRAATRQLQPSPDATP